ncbi:MAG: 4Fe-4S binding protein [Muribaculaceae bacterium]|nr:4Fe-4S binding protein [Muribaculaceae bacterium]
MKEIKHPVFSHRNCTACWKCVEACPRKAIRKISILWHKHAVLMYHNCIGCNICVKTCPHGCFRKQKCTE